MLRFLAPIFQSRWSWAIVTIVTSLVMTSGYMFTRIRGSPFTGGDGNWIAGGFQNQYGQEVSVVAFIC
jgi:oligosaccharyltransferase complex subunit gamma